MSASLTGCCIHGVITGQMVHPLSHLVSCKPRKSKRPAQTQGDPAHRPLLLQPPITHRAFRGGGGGGRGDWWEELGGGGGRRCPLMAADPTFSHRSRGRVTAGRKPPTQPEPSTTTTVRRGRGDGGEMGAWLGSAHPSGSSTLNSALSSTNVCGSLPDSLCL